MALAPNGKYMSPFQAATRPSAWRAASDRAGAPGRRITRMELPHRVYYEKELTLLLSRSYGPGRYDPSYEEGGVDFSYVHRFP